LQHVDAAPTQLVNGVAQTAASTFNIGNAPEVLRGENRQGYGWFRLVSQQQQRRKAPGRIVFVAEPEELSSCTRQ